MEGKILDEDQPFLPRFKVSLTLIKDEKDACFVMSAKRGRMHAHSRRYSCTEADMCLHVHADTSVPGRTQTCTGIRIQTSYRPRIGMGGEKFFHFRSA